MSIERKNTACRASGHQCATASSTNANNTVPGFLYIICPPCTMIMYHSISLKQPVGYVSQVAHALLLLLSYKSLMDNGAA